MSRSKSFGRLIAVLGPSGAGKDTLINAACRTRPDLGRARRVITRCSDAGGEDFDSVSDIEFSRMDAAGEFLFSWRAHGLRYGIPIAVTEERSRGKTMLFNGSRAALPTFCATRPDLGIILVTAHAEILARRLAHRGREAGDDIARRLTRASYEIPTGLSVSPVDNSGSVADGTKRFLAALDGILAADDRVLSSSRDNPRLLKSLSPERNS